MKPVFGLLLITGGAILMIGLFTGRLGLPGFNLTVPIPPSANKTITGGNNVVPAGKGNSCPAGYIMLNGACVSIQPPAMPGIVVP